MRCSLHQSNTIYMEQTAKEIKQEEALQYFINSTLSAKPYKVAFFKATGSGKSKVALECADWYRCNIKEGPVFIGANSTPARDITWPQEVVKWASGMPFSGLMIECYQSFKKIRGKHFAVGIFDECHRFTYDNASILRNNTFGAIIFLTAIEPVEEAKRRFINAVVGDNKFRLPIDLAVDLGILNKYQIYVHQLEMDRDEKYVRVFANRKQLVTEWEAYIELMRYLDFIKAKQPHRVKEAYGTIMKKIGTFKTKTLAAKYIMNQFDAAGRRYIVFAAGKHQCEWLSVWHMHSETDDEWLMKLMNGEIDHLVNVKQLQENMNIPNLQRSVTIQVNTNPLWAGQQLGRIMRLQPHETSIASFLVYKNTYDVSWMKKSLDIFDQQNVHWVEMEKAKYWSDEMINVMDI